MRLAGPGGAMIEVEPTTRWYERMPRPQATGWLRGATLRCFGATDPVIEQPALDENVVSIHLGGPKRVHRWQGREHRSWDVPVHAITLMPAFQAYRWRTEGVVAFAHLSLSASLLARLSREEFDREPAELILADAVGMADPLISQLMLALQGESTASGLRRLYSDSLLATLGITLLRHHSSVRPAVQRARGGLAGWQLRRVLEHMNANLEADVALEELTGLAGLSRAQFFRAFHRSVGETPARTMQRLRMQHAGRLLLAEHRVGDVARRLGFASASHFAAAFRRVHGVNPSEWVRLRRVGSAGGQGLPSVKRMLTT